MDTCYRWDGNELIIRLYVQPRASRDEIVDVHDNMLKLRITAPPTEGKANQRLQDFLAREFGVSRTAITLVTGKTSRRKTFRISAPTRLPAAVKPA